MSSQSRQEFIRAAVAFLQNPKLSDSPLQDKLKFLRDKGLTDIEVDEALNSALISRNNSPSGRWNLLLILGLCVGGYKLYQAYVESKQKSQEVNKSTRSNRRAETVEQKPSEQTKHDQTNDNLTLSEILQRMSELKKLIELQRSNFASDIQSLKTLLLSHDKFAAPPVIPAWQLKDLDAKEENQEEEPAKETSDSQCNIRSNGKKKKTDKGRKDNPIGQSTNGFIEATLTAPILE